MIVASALVDALGPEGRDLDASRTWSRLRAATGWRRPARAAGAGRTATAATGAGAGSGSRRARWLSYSTASTTMLKAEKARSTPAVTASATGRATPPRSRSSRSCATKRTIPIGMMARLQPIDRRTAPRVSRHDWSSPAAIVAPSKIPSAQKPIRTST